MLIMEDITEVTTDMDMVAAVIITDTIHILIINFPYGYPSSTGLNSLKVFESLGIDFSGLEVQTQDAENTYI